MEKKIISWPGAYGKQYEFEIFDLDVIFPAGARGNYIFARRTPTGWDAVYIGEGILQERVQDVVHRSHAIKKGATHIHAHFNINEYSRKAEEEDLLTVHTEAYTPKGCNVKKDG
ncbi:hypothetical protein [Carboxylicivirga sp. RSCT41]|uniref:hypothetical protein n=1 Tax=Carboxylicivirga agarovorans TaxID=3417570 RepID=UPI003D3595D2